MMPRDPMGKGHLESSEAKGHVCTFLKNGI